MRTNNGKVKNIIVSVYFVLILVGIVSLTIFNTFREVTENPGLIFTAILLGFCFVTFLVHRVSKYFEYDSDGVKVVVINRGLLLSEKFNYREHIEEFDKPKLEAFKFHNYLFFKTLVLTLRNRNGHLRKSVFNVTLVQRKKRKYIKQSLRKIIKENRKIVKHD
jgi:hypothetical protein